MTIAQQLAEHADELRTYDRGRLRDWAILKGWITRRTLAEVTA